MTRWLALPPRSRNLIATISPVSVFSANWTKPEAPLHVVHGRRQARVQSTAVGRTGPPCVIQLSTQHGLRANSSQDRQRVTPALHLCTHTRRAMQPRHNRTMPVLRRCIPVQVLQLPVARVVPQRLCEGVFVLLFLAAAAFLLRWVADLRRVALEAAVDRMVWPAAVESAMKVAEGGGIYRDGKAFKVMSLA